MLDHEGYSYILQGDCTECPNGIYNENGTWRHVESDPGYGDTKWCDPYNRLRHKPDQETIIKTRIIPG
jgi:hypothetical protein